jgi:hypothetical protein
VQPDHVFAKKKFILEIWIDVLPGPIQLIQGDTKTLFGMLREDFLEN